LAGKISTIWLLPSLILVLYIQLLYIIHLFFVDISPQAIWVIFSFFHFSTLLICTFLWQGVYTNNSHIIVIPARPPYTKKFLKYFTNLFYSFLSPPQHVEEALSIKSGRPVSKFFAYLYIINSHSIGVQVINVYSSKVEASGIQCL